MSYNGKYFLCNMPLIPIGIFEKHKTCRCVYNYWFKKYIFECKVGNVWYSTNSFYTNYDIEKLINENCIEELTKDDLIIKDIIE